MKRVFPDMKRLIPAFAAFIVLSLLSGGLVRAQSSRFVGTWKLNIEKSKYEPGPPPKEQMRVWDSSGIISVKGIDANGKSREYGYPVTLDGKESPTTGAVPSGADTVVSKQINRSTIDANFTKGGKHIESARYIISKDGKTLTLKAQGSLPNGKTFNVVSIWDKQ